MKEITDNEMRMVLRIFKSPENTYNANSMAKHLEISRMGALKIAKRLEEEEILISKEMGKANFFRLNMGNRYVKQYLQFLLMREAQSAHPYVKAWLHDIRKIKKADAAMLFGSVLRKHKEANDIDVLFITDSKRFSALQNEIDHINQISAKRIHPMFQNREDIIKNIKKEDKPLLNALKGIVAFGEESIIEVLQQ